MAQPHKGDRAAMTLRIPAELHQQLSKDAENAKVALSQYIADLLALQAGRPDLAREVGKVSAM
ncbi:MULTISPECIES: toxin-antitoxin system HicB family antitoxin [unclassified Rhodococcus (in: high G+C Gram-positive bacteria)]|jgi:predicted HicB family RNase H-like nuclease|uniref:toxin-antitoxin system HicB family antitoxin n=1 Tax=unclassified Rhodococcus (in: high G+C Gram-positive bacteria) TaxID=192944 RepID=UPI003666E09B